ncbi:Putative Type 1 protein exporter [Colletotrichum destructivum]|uniref:Type 1 protein exporter n=1 Tax=Colletotrichum destructivum TaxID=34406 RepID=A0AAX4J1X1_9PEZI|nr:Putative Type 1 protein exporter [Colletotrichum destructivum]
MTTNSLFIGYIQLALATIAMLLSTAPYPSHPRPIKPGRTVFWVGGAQAVLTWVSLFLLLLEALSESTPQDLAPWNTTFCVITATVQFDRLLDDSSRIWTPYVWSWVLGICYENLLIWSHLNGSFDIWSYLRLIFAVCKCVGYASYLACLITSSKSHESVPQADKPHTPNRSTIDPDSSGYINRTAEEEIREVGGIFPWLKKFRIFWPHIWLTGDHWLQCCLVLSVIISVIEKYLAAYKSSLLSRLANLPNEAASWQEIRFPVLALTFLTLLQSNVALQNLRSWLWMQYETSRNRRVRSITYAAIMRLSSAHHRIGNSAAIIADADRGEGVVSILDSLFLTLIPGLASFVVGSHHMVQICGPFVILVLMVCWILFAIVSRRMTKGLLADGNSYTATDRDLTLHRHDSIESWRTVANYNRIQSEIRLNTVKGEAVDKDYWTYLYTWYQKSIFVESILLTGQFLGLMLVVHYVVYGKSTVGDIIAYPTYWSMTTRVMSIFQQEWPKLAQKLQHACYLRRLLELQTSTREGSDSLVNREQKDRGKQKGPASLELRNVSFEYMQGQQVLRDVNIRIAPNTTIALVGGTGVGKSTILSLIVGHLRPSKGIVLIDGRDTAEMDDFSIRHQVKIVEQTDRILDRTIAENVRYGKQDATQEEIEEACRKACIHDDVLRLPKGYQDKIGKNGRQVAHNSNFSGGQRQRILLARLFLSNPKRIAVLDEATSALDTLTEASIKRNMEEVFKESTVIIVAHRLPFIKDAHKILVLGDEGKIVEEGSHKNLLGRKGEYWKLWNNEVGEARTT